MAIENIDALEKYVQLEDGQKLSTLMASDDKVEIKLNDTLKVFDEDQYTTLITNTKEESETAGREKLLKKMRDDSGLNYEGVKDPANFITHLSTKVKKDALEEAKIEPDKQIQALNTDLESLRSELNNKNTEIEGLNGKILTTESTYKKRDFISGNLPEKAILSKAEMVTLIQSDSSFELKFEDGKQVISKNGEILKDDLRQPVDAGKFIKDFSEKWAEKPSGGGGGGDETKTGPGTYKAFKKEMETAGHKEGSEAFMKEAGVRHEAGTLKM